MSSRQISLWDDKVYDIINPIKRETKTAGSQNEDAKVDMEKKTAHKGGHKVTEGSTVTQIHR